MSSPRLSRRLKITLYWSLTGRGPLVLPFHSLALCLGLPIPVTDCLHRADGMTWHSGMILPWRAAWKQGALTLQPLQLLNFQEAPPCSMTLYSMFMLFQHKPADTRGAFQAARSFCRRLHCFQCKEDGSCAKGGGGGGGMLHGPFMMIQLFFFLTCCYSLPCRHGNHSKGNYTRTDFTAWCLSSVNYTPLHQQRTDWSIKVLEVLEHHLQSLIIQSVTINRVYDTSWQNFIEFPLI